MVRKLSSSKVLSAMLADNEYVLALCFMTLFVSEE
jgi:hypothetical protein